MITFLNLLVYSDLPRYKDRKFWLFLNYYFVKIIIIIITLKDFGSCSNDNFLMQILSLLISQFNTLQKRTLCSQSTSVFLRVMGYVCHHT